MEAVGETQAEAGRLPPEVIVEDADRELDRAEAAEPTEAVRMTEASREDAQSVEEVLGVLEAGQERHLQAGASASQGIDPILE